MGRDGPCRGFVGKAPGDFGAATGERTSAAAAMRHGSRAARSPPGRRSGAQPPEPLAARAVDAQQFAAPRGAVAAEADAVEREAEDRTLDPMLGGDRRDVRVVVLDGVQRDAPAARRAAPRAGC